MDSELPTTFLSQSRFHQTCIRSKRVDLSGPICMWGDPFYSLNLGNRSSTRKTQVHHSSCRRKVNSLCFFFLKCILEVQIHTRKDTVSKQYLLKLEDFWESFGCVKRIFFTKRHSVTSLSTSERRRLIFGLGASGDVVDGEQDKSRLVLCLI